MTKTPKVHKWRFTLWPQRWAYCGLEGDSVSLSCGIQMAAYWEHVTCLRCLKKRGKI